MPNTAAKVIITMGRKRSQAAVNHRLVAGDAFGEMHVELIHNQIALLTTMPIIITIPMISKMPKLLPVTASAHITPIKASGIVTRIRGRLPKRFQDRRQSKNHQDDRNHPRFAQAFLPLLHHFVFAREPVVVARGQTRPFIDRSADSFTAVPIGRSGASCASSFEIRRLFFRVIWIGISFRRPRPGWPGAAGGRRSRGRGTRRPAPCLLLPPA